MNSHKLDTKQKLLEKRRFRIRKTVCGTAARPRVSLKLTNLHIYAQAIDDTASKTLCAYSSIKAKDILPNVKGCAKAGEDFGATLKKAKIESIVFDRNGRRYHGTVKAFADGVRKAGVNF